MLIEVVACFPLLKRGQLSILDKYRPISTLSVLAKIKSKWATEGIFNTTEELS